MDDIQAIVELRESLLEGCLREIRERNAPGHIGDWMISIPAGKHQTRFIARRENHD